MAWPCNLSFCDRSHRDSHELHISYPAPQSGVRLQYVWKPGHFCVVHWGLSLFKTPLPCPWFGGKDFPSVAATTHHLSTLSCASSSGGHWLQLRDLLSTLLLKHPGPTGLAAVSHQQVQGTNLPKDESYYSPGQKHTCIEP